ncbi:preprotein translocase subunit SecG [Clostridium fermenticellae]|uniref:Protein-export membrane protein SecG n=1 Tax=Clostridium fermenticellae TaxID=2068654 RepID=A0A386H646_9CLOT|nr:preprotein translocase subunit SecG [Clostridium fermenticellae]AYD41207.1 preprotein translocase subunit SecG [Clostridium fermenticellae]
MKTLLIIFETIIAIAIIAVILVQPGKTNGLSGFISGGVSETFYSKNKSRTSEAMLIRTTVVLSVIFAALCIIQNLIK